MSYLKYDGSLAAETAAPIINLFGSLPGETLTGTAAATALWGDQGRTLIGNSANDTFYLKSPHDTVTENVGAGTDKIVAWTNVDLVNFPNIENLEVDGDKTYGAGNSGDNIIQGGAGSQQLYGGGGQDVLIGGAGADTFIIVKGEGNDVIQDFSTGDGDVVRLSAGYSSFDRVKAHMTQVGSDVKLDLGGTDGVIFRNITVGQFSAANFQLQLDTSKLGAETFHDDFNGTLSLWDAESNPTGTWRPDFGYQGSQGLGSYTLESNGEKEVYTSPYFRDHNGDFPVNPFTSNADGTLTITAAPSTNSELFGYHYTSGMITTAQSFAQTYGYFEMRAELPTTAGAWPAFWLIPADGSWPPELDVMETLTGDPHADWTTAHSGVGGVHTSNGIASFIPDTPSGFHTYGVLWTATTLNWYVDGVEVFHTSTPADMNKPMYMIANLALGGWSGVVDDSHMPAQMKVDYIHAYALGDGSSTTVASATAGASATAPIPVGSSPYEAANTGVAAAIPTALVAPVSPPPPAGGLGSAPISNSDGHLLASAGFGSTLIGGSGADTLVSFQGNETMTGGAGADVFQFKTLPWNPTHITDFQPGVDRLDISGLYVDGYRGTDPVADGYVSFISDGHGGTKVLVDVDGLAPGHPWPDYVANLEGVSPTGLTAANVFGSSGSGATTSSASVPTTAPPSAAVAPVASSPPPQPVAVGSQTLPPASPSGGTGVNIVASPGEDTLQGGAGDDTLTAGAGPSYIRGGAGNDVIHGGSGFDDINGNQGDDTINGGSGGGDWLVGGQGNDLLIGHGGGELIYGNLGADTLMGGGDGDVLRGGQGNDSIVAGPGAEWISGDRGDDTLQAGSGPDTFHTFAQAGMDRVLGFKVGVDHVQLDQGTHYVVDQVGNDTVIDMGGGNETVLVGVSLSSLQSGWILGG